ncbi:unnamed protein product [Moneuplotes crassus]|uniref:Uncharacterized protein n=2 Tax=Euplotes crassus TaxID=5936 RepID=A0AAD2CXK0_EUPCR|nr:unnamed protein product [Moneuplotes crassus]
MEKLSSFHGKKIRDKKISKSIGLEKLEKGLNIEIVNGSRMKKKIDLNHSKWGICSKNIITTKCLQDRKVKPKDLLAHTNSSLHKLGGRFKVESELNNILEELQGPKPVPSFVGQRKSVPNIQVLVRNSSEPKIIMSDKGFELIQRKVTPKDDKPQKREKFSQLVNLMNTNFSRCGKLNSCGSSQIPEFNSPSFKTPKLKESQAMTKEAPKGRKAWPKALSVEIAQRYDPQEYIVKDSDLEQSQKQVKRYKRNCKLLSTIKSFQDFKTKISQIRGGKEDPFKDVLPEVLAQKGYKSIQLKIKPDRSDYEVRKIFNS